MVPVGAAGRMCLLLLLGGSRALAELGRVSFSSPASWLKAQARWSLSPRQELVDVGDGAGQAVLCLQQRLPDRNHAMFAQPVLHRDDPHGVWLPAE